jgi:glycerol-3-phosphate responsive antiterminator
VNRIAKNGPAGVVATKSSDADTVEGIEGDDVAFPCIHAADRPDGRIAGGDATISVAQRRAVNVGADFVCLDHHACRTAANKDPIGTRVDYIARAWRGATDGGFD